MEILFKCTLPYTYLPARGTPSPSQWGSNITFDSDADGLRNRSHPLLNLYKYIYSIESRQGIWFYRFNLYFTSTGDPKINIIF